MKRKLALTLSCLSILTLFMTGCGEVATVADAESTTVTESGSTEETTEELASAMAQADLTATPSPAPTASPIPTATPEPEPATRTISPDYSVTDLSVTMYAKSTVNVRSLPDTTGDKLGSLKTNEEVTVTGKCNETGWYEIAYGDSTAYVSDAYLVSEKAATTVASTGGTGSAGRSAGSAGYNGSTVSGAAYEGDPYAGLTLEEIDAIYANMTPEELMAEAVRLSNASPSNGAISVYESEASFKRDWGEQVLALVNAERAEAGLGELVWDEELYDIAVQRCYENDAHASMRAGTSENYFTGAAGSAQHIHNAWHNSQGHYDNYMRSDHERGAVAVYYNGYSLVAYEVFSDYGHQWTNPDTGETETIPVDLDNPYISNFQWLDDDEIPDWAKPYFE